MKKVYRFENPRLHSRKQQCREVRSLLLNKHFDLKHAFTWRKQPMKQCKKVCFMTLNNNFHLKTDLHLENDGRKSIFMKILKSIFHSQNTKIQKKTYIFHEKCDLRLQIHFSKFPFFPSKSFIVMTT